MSRICSQREPSAHADLQNFCSRWNIQAGDDRVNTIIKEREKDFIVEVGKLRIDLTFMGIPEDPFLPHRNHTTLPRKRLSCNLFLPLSLKNCYVLTTKAPLSSPFYPR